MKSSAFLSDSRADAAVAGSDGPGGRGHDAWRLVPDTDAVRQQPDWADPALIRQVRAELAGAPGLVTDDEVNTLRSLLVEVAMGRLQVIQAGDCAEDPAECTSTHIDRKVTLLDVLAGVMKLNSAKPVLRVGRIAGQFAKPRSERVERRRGLELPVYRGHLVNSPEPDPVLRRPDPNRLLTGYQAASTAMDAIRRRNSSYRLVMDSPVWTSHEALLLDYELPLVRRSLDGGMLLSSTHWPWVGERTRQDDSAHVSMLATVMNPVACKLGPGATPGEVVRLCERLDPGRTPGRLTFIARLGADVVADALPPLVAAARDAGHPVIWLCDPLHGNTMRDADGLKVRFVKSVIAEVKRFRDAVASERGTAGGLHLETTPAKVVECVYEESRIDELEGGNSLCDPRLNLEQAIAVASEW